MTRCQERNAIAGVLAAGVNQKWAATFNSPGRAPVADFLADHGGWLLLIPVAWVAAATAAVRAAHSDRGRWAAFASGFVVIGVLVIVIGVVNPWVKSIGR